MASGKEINPNKVEHETVYQVEFYKCGKLVTCVMYGVNAGIMNNYDVPSDLQPANSEQVMITGMYMDSNGDHKYLGTCGIKDKFNIYYIPTYGGQNTKATSGYFYGAGSYLTD